MNDDGAGDYYKQRAVKRLVIIVGVLVIAGAALWFGLRSGSFNRIASLETSAQQIVQEKIVKNFSAPTPLVSTSTSRAGGVGAAGGSRASASASDYTLTRAGVIADTNEQRAENGNLPPLAENATLDEVATLRLQDMFARQYFAHISPPDASGATSSAITVADSLGYSYINLGENLALGDFDGDQGVVTAWMNSPGHRANILDPSYTQIGVAVGQGMFQGEEAWIAVQVFGRPASACPTPDANLQATIQAEQTQITSLQAQLATDKAEIDAAQSNETTDSAMYSQEVSSYNALVVQYNTLSSQTQTEISQYDSEVNAYNACIGASTTSATSSQ